MDTWDILSPDYITDFFAIWYTEWWAQTVMVLFLGLPLLLFVLVMSTKILDKQKPPSTENNDEDNKSIWQRAKKNRLLILAHRSDKICQERGTCWIWVVVGLIILFVNGVYGYFYFKLSANPNIITTDTLQTLNQFDFEMARQFLYRYIALGWTLMLISLAFCMLFLERGLLTIKHILRVVSYSDRPPSVNIDSSKDKKLEFYVTEDGEEDLNEVPARSPSWITFKYCEAGKECGEYQLIPSGWYVIVEDSEANVYMDEKKLKPNHPYTLNQLHWLQWEYKRQNRDGMQVMLQVVIQ